MHVCVCARSIYAPVRAEPVLARIKEDRKRIILPSIDNIKHDTFEVERYENSGHGYNWELWCMYINPPKQWWDEGDTSAPIRQANADKKREKKNTSRAKAVNVQKWRETSNYFRYLKMHVDVRVCTHTAQSTSVSHKSASKKHFQPPACLALCLASFHKKQHSVGFEFGSLT